MIPADAYTYISFINNNTGERDMFRCIATSDNDAMDQFYEFCRKQKISGTIVSIG